MFVIKYSSLHSRCAADIYFFPFLSRSISCPNSLCHLCIGMQSICKFCRQISDAPYSGLPKKNLERWDGGRGGAQSCRITCKFSTSPSIGWHGTSFDQKLTAQQYTEDSSTSDGVACSDATGKCHLYLTLSISLFPSVPRWQHNKSSVNWFQNFNGKKVNARTHMLP